MLIESLQVETLRACAYVCRVEKKRTAAEEGSATLESLQDDVVDPD